MSTIEAAGAESAEQQDRRLSTVLSKMEEALRLLDEGGAPHDVGAHLDLAVQRLREAMSRGRV